MAAYITVGAKTSHGGTVISGSPHTTHNGIPISSKGDKVVCKKCKKVTTILTGDPSFIVDGAPIARGGDVTSCGAKLIAIQQAFAESDFEVFGVEQAAPLVFAKSDPDALFANLKASDEMSDEELYAMNDQMIEDAIADGGMVAARSPEELAAFRRAKQQMGGNPSSRPYNPGKAWDNDKLARTANIYGENSKTGQVGVEGLKERGKLADYNAEQARRDSIEQQSIASRARNIQKNSAQNNAAQQRPLGIQQGQPPSLYDEIGYENPMAKVRDGWKSEAVDGIKKTGSALDGAGRQVNKGYDAGRTVLDNVLKKNSDALKDQAVDKATETGKSKFVDKAKDFAPKPVRKAWDAYDDYNAVKEKGSEIQDAIPKDK